MIGTCARETLNPNSLPSSRPLPRPLPCSLLPLREGFDGAVTPGFGESFAFAEAVVVIELEQIGVFGRDRNILLHDSSGKPFLLQCSHQFLIVEVASYLEGLGAPDRRMGLHPGN